MQYKFYFLAICLFSLCLQLPAQAIKINEVVAANTQHFDEDGDSPDWLELRNFSTNTLSLNGWQLTDDLTADTYWTFPDISLDNGEHLQIWASGKDRTSSGVARTLISQGDEFRFVVPNQPVSSTWRSLDFNDSSWPQAISGFGYGDDDDATEVVAGSSAVFLRKSFTLADITQIESLFLDIDYDDAFVAYLNGVEIARANIIGQFPAYNDFAITDREAEMYTNGLPERFFMDTPQELLLNGENVLCIQVHNISNTSSDLSIIPFLSAIYSSPTNEGSIPNSPIPIPAAGLHTDFKISTAGETLYLLDAAGAIVDSLPTGELLSDLSLGIPPDDEEALVYFSTPTPGALNTGDNFAGILTEDIVFSHPGGTVSSFSLALSGVSNPAVIRYTLDATIPDENSAIYSAPIPITNNTVVRARAFRANYLPSPTASRVYLVDEAHDLPIISLITEPDNLFDNEEGIYVLGDNANENFPHFGANFWEDWERPVHLSLYESNGQLGFAQDAGIKIFGGWSRGQEQRSFSLFARQQYGPDEIAYPLFSNRDYDSYQALVLRNAGNDFLNSNMRDRCLTSLMEGSGLDIQANRPAATYINGEYWGFYNIREKVNEHFLAAKYQLDPDEINLLEFEGSTIHGDNQAYTDLINFVTTNSLVSTSNYQQVVDQIDIDNYIIYQVAQIYFNNTDWPGNNIKFWQPTSGKWRWILFDTDFGFGTWNLFDYFNNTLDFALDANGPGWPNPPWSTLLFRKLTENINFRNQFINRYADELNSRFLPDRVTEHIDTISEHILPEINRHYPRWGGDIGYWNEQINNMKTFGQERPLRAKQHIRSTFNLVNFHRLTLEIENTNQGYVLINNRLTIEENNWNGDYFQDVPFALLAIARPGFVFSHWESVQGNSSNAALSVNLTGPATLRPVFMESTEPVQAIVINEINYNSSEDADSDDWVELYNPNAFPLDLSQWTFRDNDDAHNFIFPQGTLLAANDYLIVTKDLSKFQALYPEVNPVIGDFDFGLSSNEDAIRIYNAELVLQDEVNYTSENPWPEAANGQGPTLELIGTELDNSLAQNWANVHPFGSPGETNIITNNEEVVDLLSLAYFPNPFEEQAKVAFNINQTTHLQISLYNAQGAVVSLLADRSFSAGQHELLTNWIELPSGVYFLTIIADGTQMRSKEWVKI